VKPLAAGAVLVGAAAVVAAGAQQPTFRTGANYIRVDVYPTRNGAPVADLTRDDFEVLEDKVPQTIEQFERVEIRGASTNERVDPTTVRDMRSQLETTRGRVFVVFLDIGHVTVAGSFRMRQPLTDALDRMIGADDLVAVMTPSMSPNDLTFARKTQSIEGFLARHWNWGEAGDEFHTPITDPVEKLYETCYGSVDDPRSVTTRKMISRRRELFSIGALRDLMLWLRGVREERKAVIFVSNGFPVMGPDPSLEGPAPAPLSIGIDPRTGKLSSTGDRVNSTFAQCDRDRHNLANLDDRPEFRDLLDRANAANASIYPISPAGLSVTIGAITQSSAPGRQLDQPLFGSNTESLQVLALNTDGLAIVNSNDLAGGMRRIVGDLTSYYLLGYYSSGKLDGRFHSITVRVKRPGVQVRARRGYLAARPEEVPASRTTTAPAGTNGAVRALEAALSPLDSIARDAPLRLQTAAGWTGAGGAAVWIAGELSGDDWKQGADADVQLTDANRAVVATARVRVPIGERVFRVRLMPAKSFAGDYTVDARVRPSNGQPVSETAHVSIPDAPASSGVVFIRRGLTTGNKDVPAVDRRFHRNEQLRVEIPIVDAAVEPSRLLDRSGRPLAVPVVAGLREDADGSKWQTAQLSLAPLAPGDYIVEVGSTLAAFRIVP